MKRCPCCSEEVLERAIVCQRCRSSIPAGPVTGASADRWRRLASAGLLAATALVLSGAAAVPVYRFWKTSQCQPESWADWSLAEGRQCLSRDYVCRKMTTGNLLKDPQIADDFRRALAAGADALGGVSSMVGRMRDSYGCAPEPASGAAAAAPWLPPGHPPVGQGGPGFGALPPGHPPLGPGAPRHGRLPPGHPPVGFEPAPTYTL